MRKGKMDQEALRYHSEGRPGKIAVVPTKPYHTQHDLSLAYSPGVAAPCREIEANPEEVYRYTNKGNLVAVISNGTAVLGLGNIGALAGKPVMEGKSMLFKTFADIDAFDIEVDETDPEAFIRTVKAIAPTFGGINLEDIKAPECFGNHSDGTVYPPAVEIILDKDDLGTGFEYKFLRGRQAAFGKVSFDNSL